MMWIWMLAGLVLLAAVVVLVAGRQGPDGRRQARVVLREERLRVRKTREQVAEVTTRKEVRRELKTVTVPVRREELVVEKNGAEAARIPLCEERVDVSTRSVPLNDVSVYRRAWEEQRRVEADLKKEVARIAVTGDAPYTEGTPAADESPPPG